MRLAQLRQEFETNPSNFKTGAYPNDLRMSESILFSMVSGSLGGVAGNPADLINVRMQNDRRLPPESRRNYRNVFDGLLKIVRQEGPSALFNGLAPNIARAALMTTGQLASYDSFKHSLVARGFNEKHIGTHLTASCLAGVVATVITQPVDVIKTRMMNAGGASTSTMSVIRGVFATEGPTAFFKGFTPALTRLGPHTVATFILLEQLKKLI